MEWNVRTSIYVCMYYVLIYIYICVCVCVCVCVYYEVSITLWFRWLAGSERHKKQYPASKR